jgi:ubiquinone/menaquinone biosynthesis C-methylase UbiE
MDYDGTTIASSYDAARSHAPDVQRRWLDVIERHAPADPGLILDVGCGTGRFTYPLAERFGARVIGVDPSESMLEVARGKGGPGNVEFRRAPAERLPLEDAVADMIFMSMVLHHLPDQAASARECRRVLRRGGRLCVRNCTRDTTYPQSRFFPGMQPMLDAELPSAAEIMDLFAGAGFTLLAHEPVWHSLASDWRSFADKLALRADSFLARLPDSEFEAGLAELRAFAATRAPEAITERIDFFAFER